MMERKAFLANPKDQYRVSQWEEYDCHAHNKNSGDYYEYPSWSHFMGEHWLKKVVEKKLLLQIQSINVMYPNEENTNVVPITKGVEIIMSIQVCLTSSMNINFKKNGGKKSFPYKSKASISCILMKRTWL